MLVFHPAGESHSETHETAVISLNVEVSAAWTKALFDCVGPLDRPSEFRGDDIAAAGARLLALCAIDPDSDADSVLAYEALSWEILGAAGRRSEPRSTARAPHWIRHARDIIDGSFREPLDIHHLAREAGVHPVYFAAAFRRFFGCSVGEYRRRLRLEFVCRKLADPAMGLAQIAHEAGFADQAHLSRAFKRFSGKTPAEHRSILLPSLKRMF
jgi:AraC family transcriptional regulator